jgi:hypothetical protein
MKTTIGEIKALIAEVTSTMEPKDIVTSIKKQLGRARNDEDLRHIVDAYDAIIGALMLPEHRQDEWASKQDPFTKWHYRQAKQQMNAGKLNIDVMPSGDELYAEEEHKREETRMTRAAAQGRRVDRTPEERAHDQHMAVYGGEENYNRGVGLGT